MRSVRKISRKELVGDPLGYFLAGFVEGEGSFNLSLRKKDDYGLKWQVVMSFNVSQKDPSLLYLLKDQIGCGIIKIRKFDNLFSLDITNPQDIICRVVPYFQQYPLFSKSKKKNFFFFCEVANLMNQGMHRTEQGLRKILEIRELINKGKGRKRKYGITDIFSLQKSPETIRRPFDSLSVAQGKPPPKLI